jgi:hypothetical protein
MIGREVVGGYHNTYHVSKYTKKLEFSRLRLHYQIVLMLVFILINIHNRRGSCQVAIILGAAMSVWFQWLHKPRDKDNPKISTQ